jgi:pyruvate dehydrogenase (quinone)
MTTVAENIVSTLVANGIDRVYGLPGDSLNGFTDALRRDGSIRWLHVRHEETAAFAAAADAHLTGDLSVVAGSCGPGNLHLINGLYDAHRSRVPVLAIAAHIPTSEIGSNYFQETHPQELFAECSSYAEYVADPSQMPRVLEIAMRTAIEERGVAVVVIPGDVALAEAVSDRATVIRRSRPVVVPSDEELDEAASLLNKASKVTILAGAGTEGAHAEVIALAAVLSRPGDDDPGGHQGLAARTPTPARSRTGRRRAGDGGRVGTAHRGRTQQVAPEGRTTPLRQDAPQAR